MLLTGVAGIEQVLTEEGGKLPCTDDLVFPSDQCAARSAEEEAGPDCGQEEESQIRTSTSVDQLGRSSKYSRDLRLNFLENNDEHRDVFNVHWEHW